MPLLFHHSFFFVQTGCEKPSDLHDCPGCSSEESHARKAYLVACDLALRNNDICTCTYDKLREKHSAEEIRRASTSGEMSSGKLARDMAQATLECVKRVQAGG